MPIVNGQFTALELPDKHYKVIFDQSKDWRIRALWGGRNGAKDWSFDQAAVEIAVHRKTEFLFTREVQKTLASSAKKLISDQIDRLGYRDYFKITENRITGVNGSIFMFTGLNDLNVGDLKSTEGVDIAVIGEAENLTKDSWLKFNQTIRKPGSEIWIAFNPANEDDFVYQLCVVDPPDDLIGCEVNGYALDSDGKTVIPADNPYVTDTMLRQAQYEFNTDRDSFNNHCLGIPMGGGGRVYGIYSQDAHLIDFERSYLSQCDLYMSIDPHRKYYPAITWNAITPTGCVITYNEWPKRKDFLDDSSDEKSRGLWYDEARETRVFDMSMKELASIILSNDLTIQYGGRIVSRTGDPRFFAENPDFTRELIRYGVHGWTEAPFELIETQRNNLRDLLMYRKDLPPVGVNSPAWYVARECENVDRALRRHYFSKDKDKETEDFKDFIDSLRYFLSTHNGRPRFIERKNSSGNDSGHVNMAQVIMGRSAVAMAERD